MKILLLTFNEHEEKAIDKILATISDCISLEAVQTIPVPAPRMSFPGLEIRQSQHRVIQGEEDVNLTRFEYNTLVLLASNPGIVLTRTQIFEAVWSRVCKINCVKQHRLFDTPLFLYGKKFSTRLFIIGRNWQTIFLEVNNYVTGF